MKHVLLLILVLFLSGLSAQLVNLNPDPNGEPWYAGGLRPLTAEDYAMLDRVPRLTMPPGYDSRHLRNRVNNAEFPWFRPVFNQDNGSCSQASGVGYAFTYEIDRLRNLAANVPQNQYPTHFTYNFLNRGVGTSGSWYFDGWAIISALGCPNIADYGGSYATGGVTRWINGFPAYSNAMQNRVNGFSAIDVGTPAGLTVLKQWMTDHLDGSDDGGLAVFSTAITGYTIGTLPAGTPYAGSHVVTGWGPTMDHAMTFVGFDDSICWDYNNDGQYTNNIDINGDQVVNMLDWEVGAMIVANSWGTTFGNSGFTYMMYRMLSEDMTTGGIWNHIVHVVHPAASYNPQLVLKATVRHTSRNKLRILAGMSANPDADSPDEFAFMPMFNYQGGNLPMQGNSATGSDTLQFGMDISPLIGSMPAETASRLFVIVDENDPTGLSNGEIVRLSILVPSTGQEYVCPVTNTPIANNSRTTVSILCNPVTGIVSIDTPAFPPALPETAYSLQLEASGGAQPYDWILGLPYAEGSSHEGYQTITGTNLTPNNLDDGCAYLPLPFTFPFYGSNYTGAYIMTDGSIVFENSPVLVRNVENLKSQICIAPYGADLMIVTAQGNRMAWAIQNGNLIIDWHVARYENQAATLSFQAILSPTGDIAFRYGPGMTPSGNWVAGISNGSRDNYQVMPYSGDADFIGNFAYNLQPIELPSGASLSSTGLFSTSGVPANHTWDINIRVKDANRIVASRDYVLSTFPTSVQDAVPVITNLTIHPQPFRLGAANLNIAFDLAKTGKTRIILYDIKGRKLTDLYHGTLSAGNHNLEFDFSSEKNTRQPSGLYLCKISSDGKETVRKLLMLR